MNSYRRTPRIALSAFALAVIVALVAPMNFVLMTPGDPAPLFPKTLTLKNTRVASYPVNGQMYLLTVYVTNPETKVLGAEVVGCWVWGDCTVLPRSVIYQRESSNEKELATGKKEMRQSQSAALTVAKRIVGKKFPSTSIDSLRESSISVGLKNVGGPSGGLIFTLGLIDLITPEDLLQGRKIAATGTMDSSGNVGAIGGVTEKILGAKKAKANVIFVPRQNCDELTSQVTGISVIAVNTIDEAIAYLTSKSQGDIARERILNSEGIHGCANLGA